MPAGGEAPSQPQPTSPPPRNRYDPPAIGERTAIMHESGNEARKVSAILLDLANAASGDRIRLGGLVGVLGDRAFGILILIFALPNAVGLGAIPGVSAVFGLPQLFVALQMMVGRKQLWLPNWLLDRSIARSDFAKMVDKSLPYLLRAERVLRPRLLAMSSYAAERFLGFVFAVLAGIVSLPIPFGNQPPAVAMAIISVGLAERDGVTVIVGLIAAVIAIAIAGAVVVGGLAAIYLLFDRLF